LHTSSFYFYSSRYHLYLHSFPTRRSSDLIPADLLIRDSLLRLGLNHDLVVIGIGKETFRDSNKHVSGGDQYQNAECQRQRTVARSEEHTSELQSRSDLVCRLLLEKKKKIE